MKSDSLLAKLNTWMTHKLRVTCRDTTPLISELMDHRLPLGKRMRLKFHLALCDMCRFYQKQLKIIQALARKLGQEEAPSQKETVLSEQTKIKIKDILKQSS